MSSFDAALESLEGASLTSISASMKLPSPIKGSGDKVARTPQDIMVAKTGSQNRTKQSSKGTKEEEHTEEAHGSRLSEQKHDTIETLKDKVEMARMASMTCHEKLKAILKLVATDNDVSEFYKRSNQNILNVFGVVRKGVAVKKATKYKLVQDGNNEILW